jgi:hypothetical protein
VSLTCLTRRFLVFAVGVVATAALAGGCAGEAGPSRNDVLAEAELTYPGATETVRTWSPEDHDVAVDGLDLSSVAMLTRRFRLRDRVPRVDLFAWYRERLEAAGWTAASPSVNAVFFVRPVGDRRHTFHVEAGTPLVDEFTVDYRIGFRDERFSPSFRAPA